MSARVCLPRSLPPPHLRARAQVYRQAVDAAWEALHGPSASPEAAANEAVALSDEQRWDLEQVGLVRDTISGHHACMRVLGWGNCPGTVLCLMQAACM